jgi:hypothetical protein
MPSRKHIIRIITLAAVLDCFQNMDCINGIFALKVCYRPGNPENAMVSTARKA